jgi:5-hydroxyisourate hydrolase
VLDTTRGKAADGIPVLLRRIQNDCEVGFIANSSTNADGRVVSPFGGMLEPGLYEIRFFVAEYFARLGTPAFYDEIPVRFRIDGGGKHYHIPILLSQWGYSTYRGS